MFLKDAIRVEAKSLREIKDNARKEAEYRIQRAVRGYADADLWNFEHFLAEVLCKGLKQFRDTTFAYPTEFDSIEEWKNVLSEMSDGFCFYNDHVHDYSGDVEAWKLQENEIDKRLKKSLKVLRKHFQSLWW